jgi:hypothetical protein
MQSIRQSIGGIGRFALITFALFHIINIVTGYYTNTIVVIPTDNIGRIPQTVRVCPSNELYTDTKHAVEEWNRAIKYFSMRFLWFNLLGLKFEVAETNCDAKVVLSKTKEFVLGVTYAPINDSKPWPVVISIIMDGVKEPLSITHLLNNSNKVWFIVISDTLQPERRAAVITHELSHVLGLLDSYTTDKRYRPATDTSGPYKVTSYDIYALYSKYNMGRDGEWVVVPPYIPYITADMPLPDIASAAVSALTAFMVDRKLWRRVKA